MVFEFQLLSLLMIFLLVITYYSRKNISIKKNRLFRSLLLITYIMQLCSLSLYITFQTKNHIMLFSKVYLIAILLWFAGYSLYYGFNLLKIKHNQNQTKLKEKTNTIIKYFLGIQFISILIILFTNITYINEAIDFSNNIIKYFIGFYLLIEVFVLLKGMKQIERNRYVHLVTIFLIQFITVFLQYRSNELPILNIGMIVIIFYNYFFLDNIDKEELKIVSLERDNALRQSIDKSQFLKNLSHQIRTPLNTIDGFSQVILDSDNIEEIKNDVKDIRLASRELIEVINGMIDLSIIESGSLKLIPENYNVYDMFDEIIEITNSKITNKEIKFTSKLENNIPEILFGDSERISQVILNLLKNSIKYTEKGTIKLEVESVKSNSICRLKITVSDTGKGIAKDELKHIFERKDSTHLGLAISKHLIDLMDGTIDVKSTDKEGTIFTITVDQKIIHETIKNDSKKVKQIIPFSASGKRILIVDDNKLNLKVVSKLLQPYKVEIVDAISGSECLNILEKDTNFDLILMDDLMPEMSGTECLDIIKKIERVDGFYIPVVVLTANAVNGMKEKYINSGFEDYLAKPIDKSELHRILKKYLKERK